MGRWLRYNLAVLREALRRFTDDDHAVYAGHMAFTAMLSLGPFIVCAIVLMQQFDAEAATHLTYLIEGFRQSALIPEPMANLLTSLVQTVAPEESGGQVRNWWVIGVSALLGLYAASSAFEAARNGFNEAYDTRDKRNFVFRRFQSHMLAVFMSALFVAASILFVTVTISFNAVAEAQAVAASFGLPPDWGYILMLGVLFAAVAILFWSLLLGIHLTLPRAYVKRWRLYIWAQDEIDDIRAVCVPVTPGVRFSAIAWLSFAVLYSFLIGTFINFDSNHGVLASVVSTLMFFYVSAATIFLGAQINIATATVDRAGQVAWPHPSVPRPLGFDESREHAYQVLTHQDPSGAVARAWDYLCGGSARKRPADKVTDEAVLAAREGRSLETAAGVASAAVATAASIAMAGQ